MRLTIITLLHLSKIFILTLILRGWLICEYIEYVLLLTYSNLICYTRYTIITKYDCKVDIKVGIHSDTECK